MDSPGMSFWVRLLRLIPVGKLFAVNAKHEKLTEEVRKAVCDFQAEYTRYQACTADAHMTFKDSFDYLINLDESAEANQILEAEAQNHEDFKYFSEYINCQFKVFSKNIEEHIGSYFKSTRVLAEGVCRVGIYLFIDNGKVMNIAYDSDVKNPEDHTILDKIVNTGCKAYLDNNIPKTYNRDRQYKDSGLNPDRAPQYSSCISWIKDSLIYSRLFRSDTARICAKWNACRVDESKSGLCKSHVAVPITFGAHTVKLSDKEVTSLGAGYNESESPTIHGVIIVDYPESYLFDKTDPEASPYGNTDVNVLYQFADMLSLAILVNRNYFHTSRTVNDYIKRYPDKYTGIQLDRS